MKTKPLSLEPKVLEMAAGLQLVGNDPVEAIVDFCKKRVAKIIKRSRSVRTISDFEKLVCEHLNLVIHEIWSDQDLCNFSVRYAREENDPKFAALDMELEGESYGVLYQRNTRTENGEYQYVAFIDCRGEKGAKRFFTRWHEIAHCLTSFEQFVFPFRRTSFDIEKDPVEKLMDMIAGELGFFDPFFRPILKEVSLQKGRLSFKMVEDIRQQFCPDASFQATLNACVARTDVPTILVEARLGLKKAEQSALRLGNLSQTEAKTKECLRVVNCIQNPLARERDLIIPRQMRVPAKSIITEAFNYHGKDEKVFEAVENMGAWESSDGGTLQDIPVLVQAKKIHDRVFALISILRQSLCESMR